MRPHSGTSRQSRRWCSPAPQWAQYARREHITMTSGRRKQRMRAGGTRGAGMTTMLLGALRTGALRARMPISAHARRALTLRRRLDAWKSCGEGWTPEPCGGTPRSTHPSAANARAYKGHLEFRHAPDICDSARLAFSDSQGKVDRVDGLARAAEPPPSIAMAGVLRITLGQAPGAQGRKTRQ